MQNRSVSYGPESLSRIAEALELIAFEQRHQHGSFGEVLSSLFENALPQQDTGGLSRADEKAIQRGMSVDFAREVLKPIGIGVKEYDSENHMQTGLSLDNPAAFVKFLTALTPTQVEQAGLSEPLGKLSASIRDLIKVYTQREPTDRELAPFQFVPGLVNQATRLGFGEYASKVAESLEWAKDGTFEIRERLQRQQLLVMEGQQGFGPHQWHIDTTPERFTKHWQDAMQFLRDMRSEAPHLERLQISIIANLRSALDQVPGKIDQLAAHGYYTHFVDGPERTVNRLKAALEYMSGELDEFEREADPFSDVQLPG